MGRSADQLINVLHINRTFLKECFTLSENQCCGSGSIIICTDSDQDLDPDPDPFINRKKVRKTSPLKVPSKIVRKKTLKTIFFVGILSATDEKSRIRIRKKSVVWIRGSRSGSIPRCHNTAENICIRLLHRPCTTLSVSGNTREKPGSAKAFILR
jgi:hypothetical protein